MCQSTKCCITLLQYTAVEDTYITVKQLLTYKASVSRIRACMAPQVDSEELKLIIAVIVFSGAFANGIATLLQVGAQRDVGPSRAQLIYR
jgi:hypothetical protein